MIDLESVVAHWKSVAESVAIDRHPSVWVGHYSDVLMGDCHSTQPIDENSMVLVLASPFATCDQIAETWIIRDRPGWLLVTRLEQGITQWAVPYQRGHRFELSFGVAKPWHGERLNDLCASLFQHRANGRSYDFGVAFQHAVERGGQWEK